MSAPRNAAPSPLHRAVLAYLAAHPDAKDAVQGIADWWVPHARPARAELEAALDDLARAGWLVVSRRGETTVYALAPARLEQVRAFVER